MTKKHSRVLRSGPFTSEGTSYVVRSREPRTPVPTGPPDESRPKSGPLPAKAEFGRLPGSPAVRKVYGSSTTFEIYARPPALRKRFSTMLVVCHGGALGRSGRPELRIRNQFLLLFFGRWYVSGSE